MKILFISLLPIQMANLLTLEQSDTLLKQGGVLAYPTEAVYGLGCDPNCEQAVLALLALKQRPIEKGLILIASDYAQLAPYIDESALSIQQKNQAIDSWPGPITWIFPKNQSTPYFLTGQFNSIAVRVTNHPLIQQLCSRFGRPLVSTSANLSRHPPCLTSAEVHQQFGESFPVLQGELGGRTTPSQIRDILTGNIIRQG